MIEETNSKDKKVGQIIFTAIAHNISELEGAYPVKSKTDELLFFCELFSLYRFVTNYWLKISKTLQHEIMSQLKLFVCENYGAREDVYANIDDIIEFCHQAYLHAYIEASEASADLLLSNPIYSVAKFAATSGFPHLSGEHEILNFQLDISNSLPPFISIISILLKNL